MTENCITSLREFVKTILTPIAVLPSACSFPGLVIVANFARVFCNLTFKSKLKYRVELGQALPPARSCFRCPFSLTENY